MKSRKRRDRLGHLLLLTQALPVFEYVLSDPDLHRITSHRNMGVTSAGPLFENMKNHCTIFGMSRFSQIVGHEPVSLNKRIGCSENF
jgi:hypothetical protein